MAETARLAGAIRHSSVNGPGVRYVLFFQGCPHHCRGCQNPETWDPEKGTPTAISTIIEEILTTRYLDGLTLSGGEAFLQAEAAAEIAAAAKQAGLSVWCYTGYTFEELMGADAPPHTMTLLQQLDVLVDGRFQEAEKDPELLYRGSKNQRILQVPQSLTKKNPIIAKL